jgi:hypothetical protein
VGTGDELQISIRSALIDGDGRRIVSALADEFLGDLLQVAGDALLVALAQRVEGASELARQCSQGLRDRAWQGDIELADELDRALGARPDPSLCPLAIDLEELVANLEGDPSHGGGRVDLRTGEIWPESAIDYAREVGDEIPDDEEPDRWLWVWCEGSRDAYRDMEYFIAALADEDRAARLSIAIMGRGAFRRFKDLLACWPDDLERWYAFSNERQRGRARAWLAAAGYSPRQSECPT